MFIIVLHLIYFTFLLILTLALFQSRGRAEHKEFSVAQFKHLHRLADCDNVISQFDFFLS